MALAVGVAHALNDAYASFLHPLLPRIMENLGLSIAMAASLVMTLSLAASLLQPLVATGRIAMAASCSSSPGQSSPACSYP